MSLLGGIVGLALSFWGVHLFDLATASIDRFGFATDCSSASS